MRLNVLGEGLHYSCTLDEKSSFTQQGDSFGWHSDTAVVARLLGSKVTKRAEGSEICCLRLILLYMQGKLFSL